MKQMLRRIARFLLSFHFDLIDIRRTSMTIRSLSTILTELSTLIQTLANQHIPPIPFDEELAMADRALQRSNVFVADFDPQIASRLQRRKPDTTIPWQEYSQPPISSRSKKQRNAHEKPSEEWQLLSALQARGALHLNLDTAWNGGVRGDVCRARGGKNWSECWRREGDDGLEIIYADHARLAHGL
jgi:hypothetical protein